MTGTNAELIAEAHDMADGFYIQTSDRKEVLIERLLDALETAERGKALAWDLGYFEAVGGPDEFTPLMGQLDFGNPFRFEADEGQWLAMRALAFTEATA